MKGILADVNSLGQVKRLSRHWKSPYWLEIWESLDLRVFSLTQVGLQDAVSDDILWRFCQEQGFVLITSNRNDDGPDSLEATIRAENHPQCLPVITIANAERIGKQRDYTRRVAEKVLEYLFSIEKVRGTGRLFVP